MSIRYVSIHTVICKQNGFEIPFYIYYDTETKQIINTKCGILTEPEFSGMHCPQQDCLLNSAWQPLQKLSE